MTRATQSWIVAGGTTAGLVLGLVAGRLTTKSLSSETRANITLLTTLFAGAAGAAIASYTSAPKLTA